MTSRELHWNAGGEDRIVRIEESNGRGTCYISGRSIPFRLLDADRIEIEGKVHRFYVLCDRTSCSVWLDGRTYRLERMDRSRVSSGAAAAAGGDVRALMPGKLLRIEVAVGDSVAEKQVVAVMESMKMESALLAPRAGRIVEIRYTPGQIVEMGEVLMVVE